MKRLITFGALIAACTLAVPALAERGGDRSEARQDRQQHRIERGIRSGDLTRPEARRLWRGQDRIDRMQRHARADGRVSRHEAKRIHREVRRQNKRIYRERHDNQRWRAARHRGNDRGWNRGHYRGPAYGYRDHRPVVRHAPVPRRVYVDPDPRISVILNWP